MERDKIIQALECLTGLPKLCKGCPYDGTEHYPFCREHCAKDALALIKELTEEIKDLEADYGRVYEQAEADIHGNMTDGGTSCHWCMEKTKADTVKRMQERLQEEFAKTMIIRGVDNNDPNMDSDDVWDALALVTKEMLED